MDSAIFEQCVQNLGIIIENCQTHPLIENLKAVITTKCYTKKPMVHEVKQALKTQWLLNANSDSLM